MWDLLLLIAARTTAITLLQCQRYGLRDQKVKLMESPVEKLAIYVEKLVIHVENYSRIDQV